MANRQSSAWAAARQNERGAQRDEALPEMDDDVRGSADEDDEDFDEDADDEALDEGDEPDEGSL